MNPVRLGHARAILLILMCIAAPPAMAQIDAADDDDGIDNIAGGGGGSTDPAAPARPNRGTAPARGRPPTLSINPSVWIGARHRVSRSFLVDFYVKGKATIRENPYQTASSDAAGGLSAAWSVGGFSLSSAFEVKESFKEYYGPWNGTAFDLRAAIARRVTIAPDWTIVPAFLVGHLWSNPDSRNRWKLELSAPLGYALDKQWTWEPLIPTVSMQVYGNRRTAQRDWTMNISTGVRYQITSVTMIGLAFGYEQRQSNVASAEYSRWVLRPKLQLRATF